MGDIPWDMVPDRTPAVAAPHSNEASGRRTKKQGGPPSRRRLSGGMVTQTSTLFVNSVRWSAIDARPDIVGNFSHPAASNAESRAGGRPVPFRQEEVDPRE